MYELIKNKARGTSAYEGLIAVWIAFLPYISRKTKNQRTTVFRAWDFDLWVKRNKPGEPFGCPRSPLGNRSKLWLRAVTVQSRSHVQLFWDPMDCSLPGSSVCGILEAKTLEWVAIPFSRLSFWPRDRSCVSCIGRWILYHWAIREPLRERNLNRAQWFHWDQSLKSRDA